MFANVIINPNRPHVNYTLRKELDEQRIDARLWESIYDPDVVRSINLSHKQIIRFAVEHNIPEICIMEEDVMFTAPDAWEYFQAKKPKTFDLYLAGAYTQDQATFKKISESNEPVQIKQFAGLHCYIIDQGYYEKFLAIPETQHIDDQKGMGLFYVCAPFTALQHPGWSCNARDIVDYNCDPNILPKNCIHYGKAKK